MNREIKFRAWDKPSGYHGFPEGCMTYNAHPDCDADVIMQFVKICDKNGREVYEGDVVRGEMGAGAGWQKKAGKECLFLVSLYKDHNGFHTGLKQISKLTGDYRGYPYLDTCEVVGNIYEHPYLLEAPNA